RGGCIPVRDIARGFASAGRRYPQGRAAVEGDGGGSRSGQRAARRIVCATFRRSTQNPESRMSVISEILDRLSSVEVVKEKLRDTGARVEQWATRVVEIDRQVQDIDRRLTRIETLAEVAQRGARQRKLPRAG